MKVRRSRIVKTILACLIAAGLSLSASAQKPVERQKRVLAFHFARPDGGAFAGIEPALRNRLVQGLGAPIDYTTEYLDLVRFADPWFQSAMRDYLRARYADERFDAIIAASPAVREFIEQDRSIFGDAPLVFMDRPGVVAGPNATGIVSAVDFKGSLDAALQLQPDTTDVFVISGTSEFDRRYADMFRGAVGSPAAVRMTYLSGLPLPELEQRVRQLPAHAIIYYISVSVDGAGNRFAPIVLLEQLARTASVPVYGWHEAMLGQGIVGGRLHSSLKDVAETAGVALRVLNGASPASIPVRRIDANVDQYDWRQLQRWNLSGDRLLHGATVLFRQPSFWERYRQVLIAGGIIFMAQFALIGGLVAQALRRRVAEARSRKNEQLYRSVVDTQSDLVCRFLPDTTLTFVNDAYCRSWNKRRDELIGRKFIELIPLEGRQDVLERIGRVRRGFESHDNQVILPDGSVGWHHWINHAIVDDKGSVVEYQGVGRDITDRKRAEEALTHAEERNAAMLRAVPDLMFVIARDGTYLDYHARDPKMLFASPSTFIGKKVRDIMPPALADLFMEAIERAFVSDDIVVVEYELATDEMRYYEGRIVHAGGDRVLAIVRDQTEAARARALNRDLAGRLIASQEVERHRIARELHDDLSQKMALLTIEIDQLSDSFTAEHRKFSELSDQARGIARDIHNLSHELHPSKLRSLGLVTAVESLCRDMSQHGPLKVTFSHGVVPPDVDPDVSLCLYRITQEALHNVARHSKARDAEVRLVADAEYLTLQIADSGIGFDPEAQHAGLGIVSMRERVAFLGGRVVIHAVPGGGTRIGVRVPLMPAGEGSVAPAVHLA